MSQTTPPPPPPPNFFSHYLRVSFQRPSPPFSLPPSFPPPSFSLKPWLVLVQPPPPFFPSLPTTFLHPETSSSVTKAGKDGGVVIRKKRCPLGCVRACARVVTVWLFVYIFNGNYVTDVCLHGSTRRITQSQVQCCGSSPLANASESPAASSRRESPSSAEQQRHETPTHEGNLSSAHRSCWNSGQFLAFCMCKKKKKSLTQKKIEGGTGWRGVETDGAGRRQAEIMRSSEREARLGCGLEEEGRAKVGGLVVSSVCAFRLWVRKYSPSSAGGITLAETDSRQSTVSQRLFFCSFFIIIIMIPSVILSFSTVG